MAAVDYESAWIALQAYVASKSQHGRSALLEEMARIASEHRVPEGEISRLLRLYGVELSAGSLARIHPDSSDSLPPGGASVGDVERPGHHDPGGHDGRGTEERARAAA